jgi:hypothetical protein
MSGGSSAANNSRFRDETFATALAPRRAVAPPVSVTYIF